VLTCFSTLLAAETGFAGSRLVEVFELSKKLTNLRKPGAGITWARELMGVSKKLLTPALPTPS
jgi:hypothetical protein